MDEENNEHLLNLSVSSQNKYNIMSANTMIMKNYIIYLISMIIISQFCI